MEGRRVNRSAKQRNPLYVLFLCLIAAVFVLLVAAIVLGARLSSTQKALARAETQIEALKKSAAASEQTNPQTPADTTPSAPGESTDPANTQTPDGTTEPQPSGTTPDTTAVTPSTPATTPSSSFLDLNTVTGVDVKPTTLLDKYYTYYTQEKLNLRKGPGTNYDRVVSVEAGEQVQVAARQGNWMFAKVGSRFGWMSADYLSTTKPAETSTSTGNQTTGGQTGGQTTGGEATGGNLRRS